MDDILIERLVLKMPEISREHAEELSRQIGEKLAAKALRPGSFGTLTVDLSEQATSRNLPRLADQIVDSLLQQIG